MAATLDHIPPSLGRLEPIGVLEISEPITPDALTRFNFPNSAWAISGRVASDSQAITTTRGCGLPASPQGTIADPSAVKLYSGGFTDSGALADELVITVEVGTGGTFATCAGFAASSTIFATNTLTNFDTTHSNYTNGVVGWEPSSTPESRTFRFTIDLPSDADNSVQGDSVTRHRRPRCGDPSHDPVPTAVGLCGWCAGIEV